VSRAVDFRSAAASTTGRWGLRIGLALVVALGLVSLAAPIVVSADPTFESPAGLTVSGEPLPFLSAGHPLGTDPKGRDLLARVVYGGRVTLFAAIVAVAIAMLIGLAIGSLGAAFPRRIGAVLMRFTDLGLAIPGVLLAAAIAAVLGRGVVALVLGLAGVFWAPLARVTYGQAIVVRERTFVEAARAQGASPLFVLRRHVLPHVLPVVIAYAALSVGWAVLFESALGFLGAGVQEPTPSIGGLLGCCLIYYRSQPGLILFPTIYLALLVTAANLVGEGLRRPLEGGR
jgi:peptide/nickel transport system permease protein